MEVPKEHLVYGDRKWLAVSFWNSVEKMSLESGKSSAYRHYWNQEIDGLPRKGTQGEGQEETAKQREPGKRGVMKAKG